MEFRWIEWNIDKVVGHGVTPEDAESVVEGAADPYPRHREDDKFLVWGATSTGRLIQVVFFLDEDGDTYVMPAGPEFEVERTNSLDELCIATPAIAQGKLLIRTASQVYCISTEAP